MKQFEIDSIRERAITIRRVFLTLQEAGNPIEKKSTTKEDVEAPCINLAYSAVDRIVSNEYQKQVFMHAINN